MKKEDGIKLLFLENSKEMIKHTIAAARSASDRFASLSFHSPIIRLQHILSEDEYHVKGRKWHQDVFQLIYLVNNYKATMDYFLYDFNFTKSQESLADLVSCSNEFDGSSVSEQSEGFMFHIEL